MLNQKKSSKLFQTGRDGILLLFSVCLFASVACKSSPEKALSGITYRPNKVGFAYKSARLPEEDFLKWLGKNQDKLQKVLKKAGSKYTLQIVGHTDGSGPRSAVGNKMGNLTLSKNRARAAYQLMKKNGFSKARLSYAGIADDELLTATDSRDSSQRRITFRLVTK